MLLKEFLEDGLKNKYFERTSNMLVQTSDGENIAYGDVETLLDSDSDYLELLYSGYDRDDAGDFIVIVDV